MGVAVSYCDHLEGSRSGVPNSPRPGPSVIGRNLMRDLFTEQEEWRSIPGFDGLYEASSAGQIMSLRNSHGTMRRRVLSQAKNTGGYSFVVLYRDGRRHTRRVNRLVLMAFAGMPGHDMHAAHRDGDRDNNTRANLAWLTRAENQADKDRHGTTCRGETVGTSKLTDAKVKDIRAGLCNGKSWSYLAREFCVSKRTIGRIAHGERWGHV
jgi:hypothetical protein